MAAQNSLSEFVQNQNLEYVNSMLFLGVHPDSTRNGTPPLCVAARCGNKEICGALLQNGADVNITNAMGETPLYIAVANDHVHIVEFLLQHNADPNKRNHADVPPIDVAFHARNRAPALLSSLIAHGCHVPEYIKALIESHPTMKDRLSDEQERRHTYTAGSSLPHVSIFKEAGLGRIQSVETLLERGQYVDDRGPDNKTALYNAVVHNRTDMVCLLLEHKADPDVQTLEGDTPLLSAIKARNSAMVQCLLTHNCDIRDLPAYWCRGRHDIQEVLKSHFEEEFKKKIEGPFVESMPILPHDTHKHILSFIPYPFPRERATHDTWPVMTPVVADVCSNMDDTHAAMLVQDNETPCLITVCFPGWSLNEMFDEMVPWFHQYYDMTPVCLEFNLGNVEFHFISFNKGCPNNTADDMLACIITTRIRGPMIVTRKVPGVTLQKSAHVHEGALLKDVLEGCRQQLKTRIEAYDLHYGIQPGQDLSTTLNTSTI